MPSATHPDRPRFRPDDPCLNCGDTSPGNYCPSCGQARQDVAVSVRALLADVLEDQLILGKALPRTLRMLFLRPGKLTREFMAGRRAHYIAPFRLYLAASVVFFLLFATVGLRGLPAPDSPSEAPPLAETGEAAPETGDAGLEPGALEIQPWATNLQINIGSEETNARVRQRTIDRFGHLPFPAAMRGFLVEYLRYAPRVVFLLLPLFALILKVLYLRSGRFYVEHFVFSLHVHTFAFVLASLAVLLGLKLGALVLAVSLPVYAWLALREVYRQGIIATTFSALALGFSYFFFVGLAFSATIALTLLML